MSTADEIGAKEKPICLRLCVCVCVCGTPSACACVCVCVCVWQRVFVLCVVIACTFVSVGVVVSRCCHPFIHSARLLPVEGHDRHDMRMCAPRVCLLLARMSVPVYASTRLPGWLAGLAGGWSDR
eukprot:GHVU01189238.1.p3 GENE.GHVU01189238.1~~GHVU01189238.1.p3  ORF type:complete len:138 (+),score=5.93 GHVU01189238.1:40-414(+)